MFKHRSLLFRFAVVAWLLPAAAPFSTIHAAVITMADSASGLPVVEDFPGHYEVSGIYNIPGVGAAGESFDGQTVSEVDGWEVVTGLPGSPCVLLVPGLHDGLYIYQNELQGVANGTANEDIGEGAVSLWFEEDHFEMGLDIAKMNNGIVTLQFFTREGVPFESVTVSHDGSRSLTFLAEGDTAFACVNITNRDNAGVSYDNLRLSNSAGIHDHKLVELPGTALITACYPNPFTASNTIQFALPRSGIVRLSVYSLDGREVATPISEWMPSGSHEVAWDGCDREGNEVASGVYILEIRISDARHTRKALKIR